MEKLKRLKELSGLTEAYDNFTYKIPASEKEKIYDFYVISSFYRTRMDEVLKYNYDEALNLITETLKNDFINVCRAAIFSEFCDIITNYHSKDKVGLIRSKLSEIELKFLFRVGKKLANSVFPGEYKKLSEILNTTIDERFSKQQLVKFVASISIEEKAKVEIIKNIFSKEELWAESYGGKKWANICDGYIRLLNAEKADDKIVAIDTIYNLEHNTSSLLSKSKKYEENGGFSWIKDALDRKKNAKDIDELIDFCSIGLQGFARYVLVQQRKFKDF